MDVTQQAIRDWLTAHDLDPKLVADVNIHIGPGKLALEATVYDLNDKGQEYLPRGCTGFARPGIEHRHCEAVTYRVTMPLRSWPHAT